VEIGGRGPIKLFNPIQVPAWCGKSKKIKSGPGWNAEKYKKIKIKSKTFSKLFS
jgi:hypothetical protein